MITTVTLNPALDMTLGVKEFRPDDSNRVEWVLKHPGGKGINVSRILTVFGEQVNTIAFLGGYAGQQLRELLKKEGVLLWEVEAAQETRTNVTFVVEKDKTQTRLNQRGSEIKLKELKSLFNLIASVGDNSTFIVISGSLPPNANKDTYYRIMNLIRRNSREVKIILDADGEALAEGLRAKPFLVKPNAHELERLLRRKLRTEADICKAIHEVQKMGAENVVVSLGAEGAIALTRDGKCFRVAGPKVKVVSTVGAGDAFVAGLIYKLDKGGDIQDALIYASAVGTAMVMTPGTELCRIADVLKNEKKVRLQEL